MAPCLCRIRLSLHATGLVEVETERETDEPQKTHYIINMGLKLKYFQLK